MLLLVLFLVLAQLRALALCLGGLMPSRLADPSFMRAVGEFQKNPAEAKEKYKDSPEVRVSTWLFHLPVLFSRHEVLFVTLISACTGRRVGGVEEWLLLQPPLSDCPLPV